MGDEVKENPTSLWAGWEEWLPEDLQSTYEETALANQLGISLEDLTKMRWAVDGGINEETGRMDPLWKARVEDISRRIGEDKVLTILRRFVGQEFPLGKSLGETLDEVPPLLVASRLRVEDRLRSDPLILGQANRLLSDLSASKPRSPQKPKIH